MEHSTKSDLVSWTYAGGFVSIFTLLFSATVDLWTALFFTIVLVAALMLEKFGMQISERVAIGIISIGFVAVLVDWRLGFSGYATREAMTSGALARLILCLSSIKFLQKKALRDWAFIYVVLFFQLLLAAGSGISPVFVFGCVFYFVVLFVGMISLEIRSASVVYREKSALVGNEFAEDQRLRVSRLAGMLFLAVSIVSIPLFFMFPRVGGAQFGGFGGGLTGFTGFSDSVRLGAIGKIQQSDQTVMRVRIDGGDTFPEAIRMRGVTLDNFDGRVWRKSQLGQRESLSRNERDVFILDGAREIGGLVTQTIYLEPLDTNTLFGLGRAIAIQGSFTNLTKDIDGDFLSQRPEGGRLVYKVISETRLPSMERLRNDRTKEGEEFSRFLQLPDSFDPRIGDLARTVIEQGSASARLDKAVAIEKYLQTQFSYSLDLRVGGADPLPEFLFDVKEGHCEYFATSMAIMLRTQGIPTRVVNGFLATDYNTTSNSFVVKQREAHSWVEVYFPESKMWIPFDPTPSAGTSGIGSTTSFSIRLKRYLEALESIWIQYIVSFDNQEQQSLFRSLKVKFKEYYQQVGELSGQVESAIGNWWSEVRGDLGFSARLSAIGSGVGILIFGLGFGFSARWALRNMKGVGFLTWLKRMFSRTVGGSPVAFYVKMEEILLKSGIRRPADQTPREFASSLEFNEVNILTEQYNSVRYGGKVLTEAELEEIEHILDELKKRVSKTDK